MEPRQTNKMKLVSGVCQKKCTKQNFDKLINALNRFEILFRGRAPVFFESRIETLAGAKTG